MQASTSYLPFKNFHVVPVREISPKELKISAKKIRKDREKISHTSILNFIAKSFGVKGGFSAYTKIYEEEIVPFLLKNNLTKQADLCSLRYPGFGYPPKVSKQKIAERIFVSGLPMPKRLFTGYDFDYANTISDGYWYFNNHVQNEGIFSEIIQTDYNLQSFSEPGCFLKTVVHNLKIAKNHGDKILKGSLGYSDRSLEDFILGGYDQDIQTGFNLIGDDLVQPRNSPSLIELYNNDMEAESYKESLSVSCLVMEVFRQRIDGQDKGWVEIIPFNDNLVFLKGSGGEFDFVFFGQKDYEFQHKFMQGQLKIADVPYFVSDYAFNRWHYFGYKGWREKDSHESECHYYREGGKSSNYPGYDELLINYLKDHDVFSEESRKYTTYRDGFMKVPLGAKEICISNLISINDLSDFLSENEDYSNYRTGDDLLAVNADADRALPAACTWFDALAYCKWYGDKYKLPVRLLTSSEYLSLREGHLGYSMKDSYRKDLIYIGPDNQAYPKHPPYMSESSFQSLKVKYRHDIPKITLDNGLVFLNSNDFSEWISDKASIRSASLKSFRGNDNINRSSPPLDSSGKYRHQKIGFRICYDIS